MLVAIAGVKVNIDIIIDRIRVNRIAFILYALFLCVLATLREALKIMG